MSQKITKQILKDTVVSIKDPQYLGDLAQEIVSTLPKNYAAYLCKRLFLQYAHEGVYYEVKDLINNTLEYFLTANEILDYIKDRYPTTTKVSIYTAINTGYKLHDHVIIKKGATLK